MKEPVKPRNSGAKSRGRPRSETAKKAIIGAARELLAEGGPGAVTMDAVAARAGVGKPTVYRWWPDRHAVAMAALMESEATQSLEATNRSALPALRDQLRTIARRFVTNTGRHIASMIAASDPESELSRAFRNHFVLARRAEGKALLERAIEQKEIRANLDLEVALDLLYGPLFFRLLIGHAPLDEHFMDQVLDEFLRGMSGKKPVR
jgi:AcrR family transcriptional regulator